MVPAAFASSPAHLVNPRKSRKEDVADEEKFDSESESALVAVKGVARVVS